MKLQKIRRSQIKLAKYNPRKISDQARARLKGGLAEFGLVEPLVWNKRSGILVAGHQRLGILDEEHARSFPSPSGRGARGEGQTSGGKKTDYPVDVSVVDLDPKRERKLNLLLNNPGAQGTWDDEKLAAVIDELNGDLESTGFDEEDFNQTIKEVEALKECWQILIECQNEQEQAALLERLTGEGLKCKALIA